MFVLMQFVVFVVHVVTEGWFTLAEIFPGSISTVHKWVDGWTFCILNNYFSGNNLMHVKFLALSVVILSRFARMLYDQ